MKALMTKAPGDIVASRSKALKENGTVILKRTFNMKDFEGNTVKFWRVTGPEGHKNLNSDLSRQGLKDWGIL